MPAIERERKMSKLLYIQGSPRGERSKSSQIAKAFLESYQQFHPNDAIQTFNVFNEDLPAFDGFTVQAKYSIMHGQEHSPEERQAWKRIEAIIDTFKSADKYLISLPMWNFSIPYRLKQYIDILVQPGYTFSSGKEGYEGLVKNKPVTVVYARGGAYPENSSAAALDMQKKYMELILGFIGFEKIHSIVAEPTLHGSRDDVEKILDGAFQQARSIAEYF